MTFSQLLERDARRAEERADCMGTISASEHAKDIADNCRARAHVLGKIREAATSHASVDVIMPLARQLDALERAYYAATQGTRQACDGRCAAQGGCRYCAQMKVSL